MPLWQHRRRDADLSRATRQRSHLVFRCSHDGLSLLDFGDRRAEVRFAYLALLTTLLLGISRYSRAESASNLYLLNCWGCHGSHGEGIKGTAPPLIDLSDFLKVDGGRAYIIEVPGVSLSALNDGQIATVMNWLLETMSKH